MWSSGALSKTLLDWVLQCVPGAPPDKRRVCVYNSSGEGMLPARVLGALREGLHVSQLWRNPREQCGRERAYAKASERTHNKPGGGRGSKDRNEQAAIDGNNNEQPNIQTHKETDRQTRQQTNDTTSKRKTNGARGERERG